MEKRKYKYLGTRHLLFEIGGKEKILLPGKTYKLEDNLYISGLVENGLLQSTEDPADEDETEDKEVKPLVADAIETPVIPVPTQTSKPNK